MSEGQAVSAGQAAGSVEHVPATKRFPPWAVSLLILAVAAAIFFLIFGNWNRWESDRSEQSTDDAYVRGDLAALSTKASGIVSKMAVEEYQPVKAGQVIATIRDDDYQAQVDAAQAGLDATIAGVEELHRQEQGADAKISQARIGILAAQAEVTAAQAGIAAAKASKIAAQAGVSGAKAQNENATEERQRQEGLFAGKATTLRALQGQVAQSDAARALLAARESDMSSADAQMAARTADLARAQAGVESSRTDLAGALSSRQLLAAKQLEVQSDIEARRAALQSATIALGYTTVVAPTAGYIASRDVLPGQIVSPGTTIVSLVEGNPWVLANFKETQLTKMRPGDEAEVKVDAFPSALWKGHVLIVAPTSGAQTALLPPDNATGNFTKIVQRIPVKIALDPGQELDRLRPGMSATVMVMIGTGR